MAVFYKDQAGNVLAALSSDVPAPAGFEELKAGTVDAAREKHVSRERDAHVIRVSVGEVEHPMIPEHYIEWIALEADGRLEVHHLKPGQAPSTFFAGGVKSGTVFAFCNLHGLWSASF